MNEGASYTSNKPLRVLVCGSRDYRAGRKAMVMSKIVDLPEGSTVMHGNARGPDQVAGICAAGIGLEVEEYPADWKRHGRRAGFVRNLEMLDAEPDLVIAFWDGKSRGTAHTIREAEKRGIPVEVVPE